MTCRIPTPYIDNRFIIIMKKNNDRLKISRNIWILYLCFKQSDHGIKSRIKLLSNTPVDKATT